MTGQEIRDLLFGKTIKGYTQFGEISQTIRRNGESEYSRFSGDTYKGQVWIEGDAVCSRYESFCDGLKNCSDIYRNPEGDEITYSEYISLSDFWIMPFSIEGQAD